MKSRVLLFVASLLVVFLAVAWAADVSGKWTAQMQGRGGQTTETTFTFKVEGDKLTGTMAGPRGDVPISDGKISGDEISFSVTMSMGGNEMKMLFKGKVSGNEIKFTREREGGGGRGGPKECTAKKAS
jgi:hypothetical protein